MKPRDYSDRPRTLGEHLKKRRRELGLLQREVAAQLGVAVETLINWEKDRTRPVAAQFRPVIAWGTTRPPSQLPWPSALTPNDDSWG